VVEGDRGCYHWFSYDVAVCLVLLKYDSSVQNFEYEYIRVKRSFLDGYLSANYLDERWVGLIDAMQYVHFLVLNYWCYGHIVDRRIEENGIEWCQKYVDWFSVNEDSLRAAYDQM